MLFAIALMVAATLATVIWGLAPHMAEGRVLFNQTPDRPAAFGYRMAWLAVRSRDPHAVANALGLTDATPCNWDSGIGTVYDRKLGEDHVFITPPVNGWVFVVSVTLPHPAGQGFADKLTPMLVDLGGRFVEVQYFFSYPPIDMFAWARMIEGRLVRAFATGDEGILWNKGKTTREERELGLKMFELRGVKGRRGDAGGELILHPTEDHVMRLAHRWSLDPTTLDVAKIEPSLGLIASAPIQWRAERLRRTA
jgi:hypothetical protein